MTKTMTGGRFRLAWPAVALLALGTVADQGASSFVRAAAEPPRSKIEAGLLESVTAKGSATYWVVLREKADLTPAYGMRDLERGTYVYEELQRVADLSQAELRALLDSRGATYEPFWIVNALRVEGDAGLLLELAARSEVDSIQTNDSRPIIQAHTVRVESEPRGGNGPEWGIDQIGAVKVWTQLEVRGEGIVVANLDTGAQFDHPALVAKYRGNLGGGNFDHNYNWYDPSAVCGSPSLVPCDNVGTGTHTIGIMVGDEGTNIVGVAPNAQWVAVKACETNTCSMQAVLRAGQWVLAPRDLNHANPQPALRPDIVTVSWGTRGGKSFYQATIDAWVASGIFPAVANGDNGPACRSSASPGDYFNSYSAGAYDINNQIGVFSSRGPAPNNYPKPNIGGPGVNVRSSYPPNTYALLNGTAMGSAHVAGTVALMWSYTPAIRRVIGTTRHLLDNTARNVSDSSCGGVPDKNNVWGDGRLNAWNAVRTSPNP
jgi:hypothetical protein